MMRRGFVGHASWARAGAAAMQRAIADRTAGRILMGHSPGKRDQAPRIMQVVVPCAYSLPCESSTRPSAVAGCLPLWTIVALARIGPVCRVIGRTRLALIS